MDEKMTTKEKILDAALTLFSEKGYDATGVDELAELAGVKGPALYYHFKGKDAILNGIVSMLENYYETNFGSAQNITKYPSSLQELIDMTISKINFTVHDPQIKKVRRLIVTEQFRNRTNAKARHKAFYDEHRKSLHCCFCKNDGRRSDPKGQSRILAAEFTAPITEMVHLIDREPDKEKAAMEKIQMYIEHFISTYGI